MRQSNQSRKIVHHLDVIRNSDNRRGHIRRTTKKDYWCVVWNYSLCGDYYTTAELINNFHAYKAVEKWGTGKNHNHRVLVDTKYTLVKP